MQDYSPDEFRQQIYFGDPVTVAQHHLPLDPNMARKKGAILEPLLPKAIGLGADQLEVEYKDGYEEVFAMKSGVGVGIASFRSSSPEAKLLRNELYALAKKRQRAKIDEHR